MQDVRTALSYIDPSTLSYQEWLNVGMALKSGGYPLHFFEEWSKDDSRFKEGECLYKWQSFQNEGISLATLFFYAYERGYQREHKNTFNHVVSDILPECPYETEEEARGEQVHFLTTLFGLDEKINLVSDTFIKKGKYVPLNSGDTILLNDFVKRPEALKTGKGGAWFRINPLDGKGVFNANVSVFRYALVESDKVDLREQYRMLLRLKLPLEFIVHSGGKSLHGIVKIYARNYEEYQERVKFLYDYCEGKGFKIDRANKNPSRLSRLAGVKRGDKWQYIVSEACGFASWEEWYNYATQEEKELIFEDLWAYLDEPPERKEELIEGIVRKGHKLLITASSKAGKSYLLQNLALETCRGGFWLGRKVKQGNVLFIDNEIDRASLFNRFADISKKIDLDKDEIKGRLKVCCLRGKHYTMQELVELIGGQVNDSWRPDLIIIDPLYKVLGGDENSSKDVGVFMDYLTDLAERVGATVAVAHHHSKGGQGSKSPMDRGSGSGVFSRDADAVLDFLQLDPSRKELEELANEERIKTAGLVMYNKNKDSAEVVVGKPYADNGHKMMEEARSFFRPDEASIYDDILAEQEYKVESIYQSNYFRVEGTLREFKNFKPFEVRFDYPTHVVVPCLSEAKPMQGKPKMQLLVEGRKKRLRAMNEVKQEETQSKKEVLRAWLISAGEDGIPFEQIMEDLEVSKQTLKRYLNEINGYSRKGIVRIKQEDTESEVLNFWSTNEEDLKKSQKKSHTCYI